jgi:high-affinity nickel permease
MIAPPPQKLRNRVIRIYGFLGCFNLGAWIWAFLAFHDKPVLLGTAFLAYTFGLRHAVDADHIARLTMSRESSCRKANVRFRWAFSFLSAIQRLWLSRLCLFT